MRSGIPKSEMANERGLSFPDWLPDCTETSQDEAPSFAYAEKGLDVRRRRDKGAHQIPP